MDGAQISANELHGALHVVTSSTAFGTLNEAFGIEPEQILINEDPIYVGPAPATDSLDEWRAVREAFIREHFIELPHNMYYKHTNNWLLLNTDRLAKASNVIVWAIAGLPEYLLLSWVVYLFDQLGLDVSNLRIVQLEDSPSTPPFRGIGEVHPDQLRDLGQPPRPLQPNEIEDLMRAWQAYVSSDPNDLAYYANSSGLFSKLHLGLSQLIDRYPEKDSGLGIWDEFLLHYTAEKGHNAARVIGFTMGMHERLDYVHDDYLFPRLTAMGHPRLAEPLIRITGSSLEMRQCQVEITPFGEKVLAGEANHVEANGIDDWIGGVHLNSAEGNVVFRDGDSLILPD